VISQGSGLSQAIGVILAALIAGGTSWLVAKANRRAKVQDDASLMAKAYLDDALKHAKDEIDELREWKKDAQARFAELHTEVRGHRAELKDVKSQLRQCRARLTQRDRELAELRGDHHAAVDAERTADDG